MKNLKTRKKEEELKGDKAYQPENRNRVISSALESLCGKCEFSGSGSSKIDIGKVLRAKVRAQCKTCKDARLQDQA